MSEERMKPERYRRVEVPVVCIAREHGQRFIQSIVSQPEPLAEAEVEYEQMMIRLSTFDADPEKTPQWDEAIQRAHALVLLVRHMDAQSIQALSTRYVRIDKNRTVPLGVFIVRAEGEKEFKISCADCRQKLWVEEAAIGKRGRCPTCKKMFLIPTQTEYLREKLALPDAVPVLKVIEGNADLCRGALSNLLARTGPGVLYTMDNDPRDFLKRNTVAIQVQNGVLNVGE